MSEPAAPVNAKIFGHSFSIRTNPKDPMGKKFLEIGKGASSSLEVLKKYLKAGDSFLDIGAGVGWYSTVASYLVGKTGKVLAFESNIDNREVLKENILMNQTSNIMSTTRDNFFRFLSEEEFRKVSLVRIELKGAEPLFLQDMKKLFSIHQPAVILSFSPREIYSFDSSPFDIFAFIENRGYCPFVILDQVQADGGDATRPIDIDQLFHATGELRQSGESLELLLLSKDSTEIDLQEKYIKAVALLDTHRYEESGELLKEITLKAPEWPDPFTTLALVEEAKGNWQQAAAMLRDAIIRSKDKRRAEMFAHYKLGWHLIREGDFRTGTQNLRIGRRTQVWGAYNLAPKAPRLEPTSKVKGKTVLVIGESGFGDEIVNFRFCRTLQERGAKVIYYCFHKELVSILQRSGGFDIFLTPDQALPRQVDFWVASLDLPAALYLDIDELRPEPYLIVDNDQIEKWKKRIPRTGRPRIGVRWRGAKALDDRLLRTLPISEMQNLINGKNADFFSFQTDGEANEKLTGVTDLSSELVTWDDTAAALMQMDLIISSCTSVPHLAGALGKKTWVISSVYPYYMWAPSEPQSPWYKDVYIFQQRKPFVWQPVFQEVNSALEKFIGQYR